MILGSLFHLKFEDMRLKITLSILFVFHYLISRQSIFVFEGLYIFYPISRAQTII